jgi:glycosyltransferase involved in cell wall biosynthesis
MDWSDRTTVDLQLACGTTPVSSDLRVLICNERFLPRFGLDRILLLLAEYVSAREMNVSLRCLRYDRDILGNLGDRVQQINLACGGGIAEVDSVVAATVIKDWHSDRPDVLVSGGWPFFELAARAPAYGVPSLFIDAGAVPHDGFSGPALFAQQEVRFLRETYLPFVSRIISISEFVRSSQSEPDRGSDFGITTVPLGADHLQNAFMQAGSTPAISEGEEGILSDMDLAIKEGKTHVLGLGRFEQVGYKNSPAVFEVFTKLSEISPDTHLIILTGPEQLKVPSALRAMTTCLKTLSDSALVEVMKRCTLGISVSLWEGFNLPLAEMQWLGKPALAFAIGAHPEVVVDPWFLCTSTAEMVRKAARILKHGLPPSIYRLGRYEKFRERFRWSSTLNQWATTVEELGVSALSSCPGNRLILADVTNSAIDPANSGVIRVTRRLCAHLTDRSDMDLGFVVWNRELSRYTFLSPSQQPFLSSNAGPYDWIGRSAAFFESTASPEDLVRRRDPSCTLPPVLFFPEVILDGTCGARMDWARTLGLRTACLFYDMLAITASQYVSDSIKAVFPGYLEFVLQVDASWAISEFSSNELERYSEGLSGRRLRKRGVIWLPGQFSSYPRVTTNVCPPAQTINVLCVSTFEPRKNHRRLIEAFRTLRARRPDLSISLKLVGNRYAEADRLFEEIQKAAEADKQIVLIGNVSDSALAAEYQSATFTIYPSLIEGFGLPILESLWMGRPCICNATGVMAELAVGGGCLTVDMNSPIELEAAIERLATDNELLGRLSKEARSRDIMTWQTYSEAIANELLRL